MVRGGLGWVLALVTAAAGMQAAQVAHAAPAAQRDQPATLAPSRFVPVAPTRILDRSGVGTTAFTVDVGSAVPASATAVVVTVTGDRPSTATDVAAYAADVRTTPTTSTLNLPAGTTSAGLVTVPLPADAGHRIQLRNHGGTIRLVVDVEGYYTADGSGAPFVPMTPTRVYDTRAGAGPVAAGSPRTLSAAALRVPSTASAVLLNLTAVKPTHGTAFTVWPTGTTQPVSSNLNVAQGATRADLVTVGLGSAGRGVGIATQVGSADVVVDVAGWYAPTATGTLYVPLATPQRVLGQSARPTLGGGQTVDLALPVPADAAAAAFTLTAVHASSATDLAAYPPSPSVPAVSNVNVAAGVTTPNDVTTALAASTTAVQPDAASLSGGDGATPTAVRLRNRGGTVSPLVDLQGWFVPQTPGHDVSYAQCDQGGTAGTASALPATSFGVVKPEQGLAFTAADPCLGAEDSWAAASGDEAFYLPLSNRGPASSHWPSDCAGQSTPACYREFGAAQAADAYGVASGTGHQATRWWLDVEGSDGSVPWESSTADNAQVVAGAVAYLQGQSGVSVGLYSTGEQWRELVATPSGLPEWYATAGLRDDQAALACTTPFAGGTVTQVQTAAGGQVDRDLRC